MSDTIGGPDLVRLYLRQISQHPLLTRADEVRLARTMRDGADARAELERADTPARRRGELRRRIRAGEDAKTQFINANLRLVVSVASRYPTGGVPFLDVVQDGNLGLIRAVEKFDHRKGFKFSTYATWWIRQAISRGIATNRHTIRTPVHTVEDRKIHDRVAAELTASLHRDPTLDEIADASGLDHDRLVLALSGGRVTTSLDAPVSPDSATTVGELRAVADDAPTDAVVDDLARRDLPDQLRCLDEREKRILTLRWDLEGTNGGEMRSLDQVAEHFDLTRERVRQLEKQILDKLAAPLVRANVHDLLADT